MRTLANPVPFESVPHRFHTLAEVAVWHTRHVIADSASFREAARRLGCSPKTLRSYVVDYAIEEVPYTQRYALPD